jgi:DNA invertase Pin-like site-specific DNA recombinase
MQARTEQTRLKAAAGYVRRSTDRQEQSLEDQRRAIEIYAEHHGFEIVECFTDDAISGTSTEARKGFLRMIETAQGPDCPFRHVLVFDIKRFGRVDNDEAGHFRFLLRKAGVEVTYTAEGFSGGDSDDLIRSVKQWQARAESRDLSKVTIRGQLSVVDKGFWSGGVPPIGFDIMYEDAAGRPIRRIRFAADGSKEEYAPDGTFVRMHPRGTRLARPKSDRPRLILSTPDRVALVRRIFRMYTVEGLGYFSIAARLNAEGIPSPRDGNWSKTTRRAWSTGTIRAILRNGIYTGDLYFNRRSSAKFHRIANGHAQERPRHRADKPDWNPREDWIVKENTHHAIVSRETYRKVLERHLSGNTVARDSAYRRGRAKCSPYLLSGLMRCNCGNAYCGQTTTKGKRKTSGDPVRTASYFCSGYVAKGRTICIRRPVPKDEMEALIWQRVQVRLAVFLDAGGEQRLAEMIAEEVGGSGTDLAEETRKLRARLAAVNEKASTLLDTMTDATKVFVQEKVAALGRERKQIEAALEERAAGPQTTPIDPMALAAELRAYVGRLDEVRNSGPVEEQKTFLRGFIERIDVNPREGQALICWKKIPAPPAAATNGAGMSFTMVAGAGSRLTQRLGRLLQAGAGSVSQPPDWRVRWKPPPTEPA